MAKKSKLKVPKKVLGFNLSKGTRKDIKKLLKLVGDPETRAIALSVAGGLAAFIAERIGERKADGRERSSLAH